MNRIRVVAAGLLMFLVLSACGAPPVDEAQLPTPVPTYGPERFAVDTTSLMPAATPPVPPAEEPAAEEPVAEEPVTEEPVTEEPVTEEPVTEEPVTEEPVAEEPVAEEPVTEEPVTEEPVAEEPAELDEPTEPVTETEPTDEVDPADLDEDAVDEAAVTEEVEEEAIEPEATGEDVAEPEATEEAPVDEAPLPTATPEALVTPEVEPETEDEAEAGVHSDLEGLSAEILAAMETADPARGEQLSLAHGCVGCHSLNPDQVMVGPTWYNMAEIARTRVEGESAGLYLYNSIMHPNDYIVSGYMPNIMLQIYDDILSDQETADLIAYLLSIEDDQ